MMKCMRAEVTNAEFEYFRSERVAVDALQRGSRLLLYACLVDDAAMLQERQPGEAFYGKADCTVSGVRMPKPEYADTLHTEVDALLGGESTDDMVLFSVRADNTLLVTTPNSTENMYKVFFDLVTDRRLGNPALSGFGVQMIDGYWVDVEHSDNPMLRSMLVAKSGDGNDDGSAGALVPAPPKGPLPGIRRER